jgi:hypothetical protein
MRQTPYRAIPSGSFTVIQTARNDTKTVDLDVGKPLVRARL